MQASNAAKNNNASVIVSFLLLILSTSFSIGWIIQPEYMSSHNSLVFGLKFKNQWVNAQRQKVAAVEGYRILKLPLRFDSKVSISNELSLYIRLS
jgi:hypothetical protein